MWCWPLAGIGSAADKTATSWPIGLKASTFRSHSNEMLAQGEIVMKQRDVLKAGLVPTAAAPAFAQSSSAMRIAAIFSRSRGSVCDVGIGS
jgi:hypothetical protein